MKWPDAQIARDLREFLKTLFVMTDAYPSPPPQGEPAVMVLAVRVTKERKHG